MFLSQFYFKCFLTKKLPDSFFSEGIWSQNWRHYLSLPWVKSAPISCALETLVSCHLSTKLLLIYSTALNNGPWDGLQGIILKVATFLKIWTWVIWNILRMFCKYKTSVHSDPYIARLWGTEDLYHDCSSIFLLFILFYFSIIIPLPLPGILIGTLALPFLSFLECSGTSCFFPQWLI